MEQLRQSAEAVRPFEKCAHYTCYLAALFVCTLTVVYFSGIGVMLPWPLHIFHYVYVYVYVDVHMCVFVCLAWLSQISAAVCMGIPATGHIGTTP